MPATRARRPGGNRRIQPLSRFRAPVSKILLIVATAVVFCAGSPAQLSLGVVEGVIVGPAARPASAFLIAVEGMLGFHLIVRTRADGTFTLALPYGNYWLKSADAGSPAASAVPLTVVPLRTARLHLRLDSAAELRLEPEADLNAAGDWSRTSLAAAYPEAFSLPGTLLSRQPAGVSAPLDFTGTQDNRLALVSYLGVSWTETSYRLHGMDVTDSYQPGRPAMVPDLEALEHLQTRGVFESKATGAQWPEVNLFLTQPGPGWHGSLSAHYSGSALSSDNLPLTQARGMVQQPDRFNYLTRDRFQAGGPLSRWADLFAAGTAQWASQTIPLGAPGTEQRSRLLYGNIRGQFRAGSRDRLDALYSGARIDLSSGGTPAGIEAWTGRRMAPSLVLPGGFPGQVEVDHLDLLQVGWTRALKSSSGTGALEMRYEFGTAQLDTAPIVPGTASKVDLVGDSVTRVAPINNLARRPRHELETVWQPGQWEFARLRHQVAVAAGWNVSTPLNRFNALNDMDLITAAGAPAFVLQLKTPLDSKARTSFLTASVTDHIQLVRWLAVDLGVTAQFWRGSLPAQSSASGDFAPARSFAAQPGLIQWNRVSPRVGLTLNPPRLPGLLLRGSFARLYEPMAGRLLDYGNPNSLSGNEYQFTDLNGDGRFQPNERGVLLRRFGGAYSSISPSLRQPYVDEFTAGAEVRLGRLAQARIGFFRRDTRNRIAAIDTGVPAQAYHPRQILDPGPDGIPGTFDDQVLAVFEQDPATFGQDMYLLTNPAGLRMLNTGLLAEAGVEWKGLLLRASFAAEKAQGPANPGNAVFENDPGVAGALLSDPNMSINATGRAYMDRAYVGKIQATYRCRPSWGGVEVAGVADYLDGLPFARQLLVTGLAQGPFLVAATPRGSPGGGNRTQYAVNWNLRLRREFGLRVGKLAVGADILNVTNSGRKIQESDVSGLTFNQRLPVAIQAPRSVRLAIDFEF